MFKKTLLIAALSIGLMSTVQAADLSHTQSWGSSVSTQNLNTAVTGTVDSTTVKYATDRSDFVKPTSGCGTACPGAGNVDNDVVSASLAVSVKHTDMKELTTGTVATTDTFCDTSISGGIITATQGKRDSASVINTVSQRDNVTTIKGYDVKVDTSTNGEYPGLGKGNDVIVQINGKNSFEVVKFMTNTNGKNSFSTNAAQGFTVDTSDLSAKDVKVTGFDGTSGTENGIGLSYTVTDLKVVDKGNTVEKGNSYSAGSYSSLK